ncbi:phosphomethylpyrimidine synthase ThiC [Leptospira borgpetersenii]|nr:phosphomethylpyrimidine synthase ThiC [Leptospira borgpetersenii]
MADTHDKVWFGELEIRGKSTRRIWKENIQVMIEVLGHVSIHPSRKT